MLIIFIPYKKRGAEREIKRGTIASLQYPQKTPIRGYFPLLSVSTIDLLYFTSGALIRHFHAVYGTRLEIVISGPVLK